MSENINPAKMPLVCGACKQSWSIPAPVIETSNLLRCSVVTVAHPQLIRCPNRQCSQPYLLSIHQTQVAFAVNAVGDDVVAQMESSPIIKPSLVLAH